MMAVDIKQICDYSDKLRNVSYILTETVGTTTSYTFPEDTLLPYIKRNLKEYIINHWDDEEIKEMVVALKKQAKVEMEEGWVGAVSIPEGDEVDINAVKDAVAAYALNQIESSDLESLQHRVVKDGYSKGQLKGHLFPDVLPAFKKWTAEGKKIYMYSSGLELSQNCLISNSVEGDITELISGCFNSSEFPRTKSESFREMCKKVDCAADKVAFLTDNAPTARAARKAGLVVIMLCREGNSYMGSCIRESFPVITSFEDISQQICSKRKKPDDEIEVSGGKKAKLEESDANPEAKADKCEETVKKDVPSMTKKAGEDSKLSEEKVKVEKEKVIPTTEEAEEKMEVDEDTKAEETLLETKAEEAASETMAEEAASETKAEEAASGAKAVEAASGAKAVEAASGAKAEEAASGAKAEEAASGAKAEEAASETKAEETASETKAEETASETKAEETASETKEKTATDTKEEPAPIAIVVTPPEDDVKKNEVSGEEKMDGVEEVKKTDAKKEVEKATVAEDERKAETEAKEESSKPKEESKKAEESTEPKVEEKETKDGDLEEKTIEGEPKAEEKADLDKPSAEKESDEKKISEDASKVENGDAISEKESLSDAATENGEAGKEVCTNGVDHENGEGKENGVSSDEKAESSEKEAVKAVPKKPELESVTEAAAQESA